MPATPKTTTPDTPAAPAEPATTAAAEPRKSWWVALTNLSIGRQRHPLEKDTAADIVMKGEKVHLTEEQAHGFLTRHRKPVIRPADQDGEPDPNIKARDLFGVRPTPPAGAREDPPADPDRRILGLPVGASELNSAGNPEDAPEANDPVTDLSVDPDAAKDK